MYVYGLFRPSLTLDLALIKLKEEGATREKPIIIALHPCQPGKTRILDSMYSYDGRSLLDGMAMTASIGMLFGVIYGSIVEIGPIALGLIGFFAGALIGYILDKSINRGRKGYHAPSGEIMVAVRYGSEDEAEIIEKIMKEHKATALGRGKRNAWE